MRFVDGHRRALWPSVIDSLHFNLSRELIMTSVGYRIFRSSFDSWDTMCQQVVEFAAKVDVINISHSVEKTEGVIIVWYRLTPERR